jgi:hypothetical protein
LREAVGVTRLPFPESGSRRADNTAGHPVPGHTYTVYTDPSATTLANILQDEDGTPGLPYSGSQITTDTFGYLPIFWGPDTDPQTNRLYITDGTVDPWPVDAVPADQIAAVAARVTAIETGAVGGAVSSVAGKTGAVVLFASDVAGVETPAGAQLKADIAVQAATDAVTAHTAATVSVHGITDTSLLETQTGAQAKATAAQAAATAASDPVGTAAAAVNVHNADFTNVHGVDDMTNLETVAGAQAKADAAAAASIPLTQRGVASGVATLGVDGKLAGNQVPDQSLVDYLGDTADEAAMLALVGQPGDWTNRADLGTVWLITGGDPTRLDNWTQLNYPTAPVTSVAGRTGSITLARADVGLGNVANLAPADLPVSDDTQDALDAKAPLASPTFTGTVGGLTKAMVGLAAVDNVHDTDKPVSTPQQTALDLKLSHGELVLNVRDYGAVGNGSTNDTAAFQAAVDALPAFGGAILVPPANTSYVLATPVTIRSDITFVGHGPQASRIKATLGAFTWTTTSIHDVHFRDLYIQATGGHIFTPAATTVGIFKSSFRRCTLNQLGPDYSIFSMVGNDADYDRVHVDECDLARAAAATVPAWHVVNGGGAANCNRWAASRALGGGAASAPFLLLESTSTGAYAYDNRFEDITGEDNPAGLVWVLGAFNTIVDNVTDYDATSTYTGDVIRVGKSGASGALRSTHCRVTNSGRRGGTLGAGVYDVNLMPSSSARCVVAGTNFSNVSAGFKLNFSTADHHTLLNLPTGSWTGQPADVTSHFGDGVQFGNQPACNVRDYGAAGDGVTDDTAALNAVFAALSGTDGGTVHFPAGTYLCNAVTSGVILALTTKNNVTVQGGGSGAIIRTDTATATELFRVDTCNLFRCYNMRFDVRGTANIEHGVHITTASPGSAHSITLQDIYVSGIAAFRKVYDISTVSGSPTIYSAMAAFTGGDVGGTIMVNLTGGPFITTIGAVATLTGTLAAGITASQTTITLNAPISGAPASGFTIKVDSERMFVSAGGTTTTLTVSRGRGNTAATHLTGAAVTTYQATLGANAPSTVSNSVAAARIQAGGLSVLQNGISIGVDHPGASNLDLAGVMLQHCVVNRAARAGVNVGNGTPGNNLDHHAYLLSVSESGCGVYLNGGPLSCHGGEMSTNLVDFKRNQVCSSEWVIDGFRSEGPAVFYESTGAQTSGPAVRLSSVELVTFNGEDGVAIRHLTSGPLLLENVSLNNIVTGGAGQVFVSAGGTSSFPCYLTAINVSSNGGNSDLFSTGLPTCIRTIISSPRTITGSFAQNTVVGTLLDNRLQLGAGLTRARRAVADTATTVTIADMTVAYTTLTAARIVTLPAASTATGQEFTVKDESGSCNGTRTLTITPASGTIDGAATKVLNTAYATATVYSNGTNWFTR